MRASLTRLLFTLIACASIASCSGSNGGPDPGDTTPPTVTQTSLSDGQTDVGLIERITVEFSEDMDASTINSTTIIVAERAAAGHVEYDDAARQASFTPDTLYAANVWHEFILSEDIADEAGNPIEADTTAFRTGPLDTEHLEDYFEPNEAPGTAVPIELDRRYRTLSVTEGDDDVFEFTVAETAMIRIHAWMKAVESQTWNCEFERSDGEDYVSWNETVAAGDTFGTWLYAYSFLPGTYYFHTHSHPTWDGYLLYDFKLDPEEPCRDDYFEDNDFVEDCVEVVEASYGELRACWKDSDWFWLSLNAGDELTLSLTASGAGAPYNWRVTLYDSGMYHVAEESTVFSTMSLSYTATTSGPHFFEVYSYTIHDYEMDIEVD